MRRAGRRWALLVVVFALGVGADQASKFLAVDRLTYAFQRAGARTLPAKLAAFVRLRHLEGVATEPHVVLRPVWRMNYVENPNAAFSLFRGIPPDARHVLFLAVAVLAVAFVVYYYARTDPRAWPLRLALALVLAGTVGNVVDRLLRRYVIDFVEWHWWNRPDLVWPTFNVADAMLVVGIGLLVVLPSPGRARRGSDAAGGAGAGEGDAGKKRAAPHV